MFPCLRNLDVIYTKINLNGRTQIIHFFPSTSTSAKSSSRGQSHQGSRNTYLHFCKAQHMFKFWNKCAYKLKFSYMQEQNMKQWYGTNHVLTSTFLSIFAVSITITKPFSLHQRTQPMPFELLVTERLMLDVISEIVYSNCLTMSKDASKLDSSAQGLIQSSLQHPKEGCIHSFFGESIPKTQHSHSAH